MKAFNPRYIATLCAAVILIGVARDSRADWITFNFEATTEPLVLNGSTLLTGSYSFDPMTPDSNSSTGLGVYNDAIKAMDVSLGPFKGSATPADSPGGVGNIIVDSDMGIYTVQPVMLFNGSLRSFSFQLGGLSLSSDQLPTVPPVFDKDMSHTTLMAANDVTSTGQMTRVYTSVPEPATGALLGLALLGAVPGIRRAASTGPRTARTSSG